MEENKMEQMNQNAEEQKNDAAQQTADQPAEKVGFFKRIGRGIKAGAGKGKEIVVNNRGKIALVAGTAIGALGTVAYVAAKVAKTTSGSSDTDEPYQAAEEIVPDEEPEELAE